MKSLLLTLLVALACAASVSATSATRPQQANSKSIGFALEISYPDQPLEYLPVPAGTTSLHPGRVLPAWQSTNDPEFSWDVMISSRLENQLVKVEVIACQGFFSDRKVITIGSYLLQENQPAVVHNAALVGRVPFQITVVRIKPFAPEPPTITNRTKSIAVVKVEARDSTFLSYKLTLRNSSAKNVLAIHGWVLRNGGRYMSMGGQSLQGRPMIKAGDLYELVTTNTPFGDERRSNGQMTPEGVIPEIMSKMVIESAVFDDGSYEGSAEPVAELKAVAKSQQIQLSRVLKILKDESLVSEGFGTRELERLKISVSALNEDPDPAVTDELRWQEPELAIPFQRYGDRASTRVKGGLFEIKRTLLGEIESAKKASEQSPDQPILQTWFTEIKQRYEEWNAAMIRFLQ